MPPSNGTALLKHGAVDTSNYATCLPQMALLKHVAVDMSKYDIVPHTELLGLGTIRAGSSLLKGGVNTVHETVSVSEVHETVSVSTVYETVSVNTVHETVSEKRTFCPRLCKCGEGRLSVTQACFFFLSPNQVLN